MLFNSLSFAIFLPIVFAIYWVMPKRSQWVVLFAASYYFYMSWNATYVTLILFTTAVSYGCALLLERAKTTRGKKLCVAAALVASLSVLFVYKYFAFFFAGLQALCDAIAIPLAPVTLTLLLPVGISFYTFQTLSYVIDVYRGKVKAERHFGQYATFVSFFPQLVAGPIERTDRLLPQIKAHHNFNYEQASYGTKLMAWGFFKKIVIADVLAGYVDTVYADLTLHQGFAFIIAIFFFSLQIYCDFSGYSDIAVGVAKLFGIELMTNFKSPYLSTSIGEFWSRWHISLSTWFRDYLYIPLGGNRCSRAKNLRNVMITFLVSGLWHGANITFVVWGALHGGAQVIENLCAGVGKRGKKVRDAAANGNKTPSVTMDARTSVKTNIKATLLWWVKCGVIFLFCSVAWVFFRADTVADAIFVLTNCFSGIGDISLYLYIAFTLLHLWAPECIVIVIPVALLIWYDLVQLKQDPILALSKQKVWVRWPAYILVICAVLTSITESSAFVYFQF